MNPRERKLLIFFGGVVGVVVLYQAVNYFFISPLAVADEKIVKLTADMHRLQGVIQSRERLAKRWSALVERTLASDPEVVKNRFAQDLKALAKRYQFTGTSVTPVSGMKIGSKTGIEAVGFRGTAEGTYCQVLAFLLDVYKTPYWCQITKLGLSPVGQKGRPRDEMKLEMTLETPVAPPIDKKRIPEAADVATLPPESDRSLGPVRPNPKSPQDLPLLADRIIFRSYIAPPNNIILIDNQDWKTAALRIAFLWDGKLNGVEIVDTVAGKSTKQFSGKGDVAEVKGSYADGTSFGPERLDFNTKKEFTYVVAVHSPAPPPVVVDLAVENQDKDAIDLEVTVTPKDGPPRTKPTMRIKSASKEDIDVYECKSVQVAATYASGKKASPATYSPQAGKQTCVVPPEPAEAPPPKPVSDPAADGSASVTGLVTYRDVQEMIAIAGNQRKIFRAGAEGMVDGGTLRAVHPLGGVVRMPSGNYYLYPLGRKFSDRVRLEASQDEDLPAAIDAWTRR